ncbi:MAG: ATP-binding protein [Pyrinomonadaceae bacterium]
MYRSIRVKLTLWYVCILGLVFAALAVGTYLVFVRAMREETRNNLVEMRTDFTALVYRLHSELPHNSPPETPITDALKEFNFRDYRFAVYSNQDQLIGKTLDGDPPPDSLAAVDENRLKQISINGERYGLYVSPLPLNGKMYKLLVLYSLADQSAVETRISTSFLVGIPILLILAGLGGYLLARQGLKPIAVMGEQAKRIGAKNLHERLPIANSGDEIGNLATLFNQLLDRLDQEFERQRRFMADASHELRTPLAIVRGESEVALQKEIRSDAEYRESLRVVNDEAKRLSKIVEDLFTLARVDSGNIKANFRELYVDEIVDECVRRVRTLADKRRIDVTFTSEELVTHGDEALLQQMFLNLLDNALKYNHEGGHISVTGKGKSVTVSNTGPEIPEELKGMIFERFYRINKAHSRQAESFTSGAGLGLSIARWIAGIHQADLRLTRSEAGENVFSVTFPS